jgi:hypothetical protein
MRIKIKSVSENLGSYLYILNKYNFECTYLKCKNGLEIQKEGMVILSSLEELIKLRDELSNLSNDKTYVKNDIIITRDYMQNELFLLIYDTFIE